MPFSATPDPLARATVKLHQRLHLQPLIHRHRFQLRPAGAAPLPALKSGTSRQSQMSLDSVR